MSELKLRPPRATGKAKIKMTTVIRVEQIGKRYRVGAEAGGLLRDKLAGALRDPVGLVRRRKRERTRRKLLCLALSNS